MAKTLVIVESPTKARTLERFLGDQYSVKSSFGHVRDLRESASQVPDEIKKEKWGRLGVDTDGDFKPYYVVPDDKRKNVAELKTEFTADGRTFPGTLTRLGDVRVAEAREGAGKCAAIGRELRVEIGIAR